MENKTSTELACEKIMEQDALIVTLNKKLGYTTPANCPDDHRCGMKQNVKDCSLCWKQYFQENATEKDGWCFIEELGERICQFYFNIKNKIPYDLAEEQLEEIIGDIDEALQQVGIDTRNKLL